MQELGPIDTEALRAALEPERPDPADFLTGVRERVQERESAAPPQAPTRITAYRIPPRLRFAASLLPPGILPVVTSGAAAGAKLSWKALPGLIALPGIAFVMVLLTFFGGVRRIRKLDGAARNSESVDEAAVTLEWWKRNRTKALFGFSVIGVLILLGSPSAALFGVLASMVVLVLLVGSLAHAGFANRHAVGRLCRGVLYTNLMAWWTLHDFLPRPGFGPHGALIAGWLGIGMLLCGFASGSLSWAVIKDRLLFPIRMPHPDPVTTFSLRCLSFPAFAVTVASIIALCILLPSSFTGAGLRSAPSRIAQERVLASWVTDHSATEFLGDERVSTIARGLQRLGAVDDWRPFSAEIRNQLNHGVSFQVSDATLADLLAMHWIEAVPMSARDTKYLHRQLFESDAPLRYRPDLFIGTTLLREAGERDSERCQAWRARVVAGWSQDDYRELEHDLSVVRWLESLDGHADVAEAKSRLHADLLEVWNDDGSDGPAFFDAVRPEGGFADAFDRRNVSRSELESTRAAILLMDRVGVPEGLALKRVRLWLAQVSPTGWSAFMRDDLEILRRLTLLELDQAFPESNLKWYELLWELRQFLAVVLLVALCILAIRRAPLTEKVVA